MKNSVKNIFGVAAAILVLLGFNLVTEDKPLSQPGYETPDYETNVTKAEERSASSLKDLNDSIVDIADKTNPSVVTVTTKKTEEVRVFNPFSQFFGRPGEPNTDTRIRQGLGSGVIVSKDGYILTNNHVIQDSDEIKVRMMNGDEKDAELVGTDPQTDIAVLKINSENLQAIAIGDSDKLRVGSFVLAIGSPLHESLAHTVSFGIVSARGRNIGLIRDAEGQAGYEDFIQTDAAINPGNSGGALININGELVGINSAIASRSGGNDGIGFAIPSNLAKRIMEDLIEDGKVSRGYLGIYLGGEVDETMAKALGIKDARGIIVGKVEDGTPADEAGLKEQDIIESLNGEKITDWQSFRSKIAIFKPGEKVTLGILRDGNNKTIEVTLGERPGGQVASTEVNEKKSLEEKLGFTVQNLNDQIRRQLNLENDIEGVVVAEVKRGSNAQERGLRKGDVITAVKRRTIDSIEDFYSEIKKAIGNKDEAILLTITRQGLEQYVAFEL